MNTRKFRGGSLLNNLKGKVTKHFNILKSLFKKTKKAENKAGINLSKAKVEQANAEKKVSAALLDYQRCTDEKNSILREAHEAREKTKVALQKKIQTRVALNRLKQNKSSFKERVNKAKREAENAEVNSSSLNTILERNNNWAKNHPLLYSLSPSGLSGALSTENKARLQSESIEKKQRRQQTANALAAAERELQEHSEKLRQAEQAALNAERNAQSEDDAEIEREAQEAAHAAHNAANREREIVKQKQKNLNRIQREQAALNALANSVVVSKNVKERNVNILKTLIQLLKKSLDSCCINNNLLFTEALIQNIENDKITFKPLSYFDTAVAIPRIIQILVDPRAADTLTAEYLLRLLSLVPEHTDIFLTETKRKEINENKEVLKIIEEYCKNTENWKIYTANLAIKLVEIRAETPIMKAYLIRLIKEVSNNLEGSSLPLF
jgi:hypothetical protein